MSFFKFSITNISMVSIYTLLMSLIYMSIFDPWLHTINRFTLKWSPKWLAYNALIVTVVSHNKTKSSWVPIGNIINDTSHTSIGLSIAFGVAFLGVLLLLLTIIVSLIVLKAYHQHGSEGNDQYPFSTYMMFPLYVLGERDTDYEIPLNVLAEHGTSNAWDMHTICTMYTY